MPKKNKVFCIGFHKTGTTSLGEVLGNLGYRVQGAYKVRDSGFVDALARGELQVLFNRADQYDAFQDNPWTIYYKELDIQFPSSRFILTVRNSDLWIRSILNHFSQQVRPWSPMRNLIYGEGSPVGNEALYLARFERHNREVQTYFAHRSADLLIVDVNEPEALERICSFLGHSVPKSRRMPHANRRFH